jgi:glycosyltransferase involved in cell wall biosynthesis
VRILALEPYYGGSHRAFLDTWIRHSRHDWTLHTLPARHWKWRMRGSAVWFADQLKDTPTGRFDAIVTCDMTAVTDLRALLPASLRDLPILCYFHENQLTYPLSPDDWRDYQYGITNITSLLAADAVWFNSQAHLDAFRGAARDLLRKMPGFVPDGLLDAFAEHALVVYPPVAVPEDLAAPPRDPNEPPRILWCHRWEYDKNPEAFAAAVIELDRRGVDFSLVLVGERFRDAPAAFQQMVTAVQPRIAHCGYVADHAEYLRLVASCDWVVSTAIQENFGIAVVEAMLAGCAPILPHRLSYPEITPEWLHERILYDTDTDLAERMAKACACKEWVTTDERGRLSAETANRFGAEIQVLRLDTRLNQQLACRLRS